MESSSKGRCAVGKIEQRKGSSLVMHRTHLTTGGTIKLLCNIHLNTFKPENHARTACVELLNFSVLHNLTQINTDHFYSIPHVR